MNAEVHPADPRLRRLTLIVLGISAIAGVVAVSSFRRWLDASTRGAPIDVLVAEIHRMIALSLAGCGLCLLMLAGYAAYLARRVTDGRRWPPLRARVLRDTPVRSGADALALGRALNIAATVLIALAIGAAFLSVHWLGVR